MSDPELDHDAERYVERLESVSDRTKTIIGVAAVIGLAVAAVMMFAVYQRIGTAIDRSNAAIDYQAASNTHAECVWARDDQYRIVGDRYLEALATGPHDGEPSLDTLRKDWLTKFFLANGARDPSLKGACPALPEDPGK